MTVDYTSGSTASINVIQVKNDLGEWIQLPGVQSVNISYPDANIPACTFKVVDSDLLTKGRKFRAMTGAGAIGEDVIRSGQDDPPLFSGDDVKSGQKQTRLIIDSDNGAVTWFFGFMDIFDRTDLLTSGFVTVTVLPYIYKLLKKKIEDENGYHYGDSAFLEYETGKLIYDYDEISVDAVDIYRIDVGSDEDNLTQTREGTFWTNDYSGKRFIFYNDLPAGIKIKVYYHVEIDPKVLFDSMCAEVGIPEAYYSGESFIGSKISRVWFPWGWDYLKCLNNVADQKSARVFQDHTGVVKFAARPLSADSADVTFKDGSEADRKLLTGLTVAEIEQTDENINVTGATWYQYSRTGSDGMIADFNDGSNINQLGGKIEVYSTGEADLTPDSGIFYPSYEKSERVGKLTGTIYSGLAGIRLYLVSSGSGVDISSFTGLQFWLRGNGKKQSIYIVDSSGNDSYYNLGRVNSYSTKRTIPYTDFSGSADTTKIAYILIAQTELGRVDFSIDNLAAYPYSTGATNDRVRREITLSAKEGTADNNGTPVAYRCLTDLNEIQAIALARYNRKLADLQRLSGAIGGVIDPDTDPNKVAYIKSGATDGNYEIVGMNIEMAADNEITFALDLITPLSPTQKPVSVLGANTAFDLATQSLGTESGTLTFTDDVDSASGGSEWNYDLAVFKGFSYVESNTDTTDTEITLSQDISDNGKITDNYELINLSKNGGVDSLIKSGSSLILDINTTLDVMVQKEDIELINLSRFGLISVTFNTVLKQITLVFAENLQKTAQNVSNYNLEVL